MNDFNYVTDAINQGNIDGNHNSANKRINELAEKLAGQLKNGNNAMKDLTDRFANKKDD